MNEQEKFQQSFFQLKAECPRVEINEQINRLKKLFPTLDRRSIDKDIAKQPLPKGAEEWLVVPHWWLAFSNDCIEPPTYSDAVREFLPYISNTRLAWPPNGFFSCCRRRYRIRRSRRTKTMLQKLRDQQKGNDMLVVPVQLGIRHRGRSVLHTREMFERNEFGLGAFEVIIALLTHPKRLANSRNLGIDCAGDESALVSFAVDPDLSPNFVFNNGVQFGMKRVFNADIGFGSATGFLPKK